MKSMQTNVYLSCPEEFGGRVHTVIYLIRGTRVQGINPIPSIKPLSSTLLLNELHTHIPPTLAPLALRGLLPYKQMPNLLHR